jgi:hypothetical protein
VAQATRGWAWGPSLGHSTDATLVGPGYALRGGGSRDPGRRAVRRPPCTAAWGTCGVLLADISAASSRGPRRRRGGGRAAPIRCLLDKFWTVLAAKMTDDGQPGEMGWL